MLRPLKLEPIAINNNKTNFIMSIIDPKPLNIYYIYFAYPSLDPLALFFLQDTG